MFRRRRNQGAADELDEGATSTDEFEPGAEDAARQSLPPAPRPEGPWDATELQDAAEGRVDLGGLLVPAVQGMELRVEVAGDAIVAATVVLGQSSIALQAFAAPRTEGLWGEIRAEIASSITQQGGTVDELEGTLGWELRAQIPVPLPNGSSGVQQVRFVGCDGPRWFLRGVIAGQGAAQPQTAEVLENVFRSTVVVRGEGPMAPRDPIVLQLPDDAQMVPDGTGGAAEPAAPQEEPSRFSGSAALNPFERGPEITEVR
ncbi:hypothetical protein BIV57_07485 [Mangrovactinospora gilvigrisea]|uniref:DUF3710 domain-containing protein n=1 Tax=Mangrovactinospora gilvigrisea TaxID=1428644 RepID=A0A1J7C990_9ACTN|nr:DUF3710 domain-containing protein [Mangrovactinospora gilvigrisea]OIV38092.1 hypothetical protein BIV57_07485 [Mangrovactinospora gilvigrisea]